MATAKHTPNGAKSAPRKIVAPRGGFTPRWIDSLVPPKSGRVEIPDPSTPGLILRLSSNGRRSFFWRVKDDMTGKMRRISLGTYGPNGNGLSLRQIREKLDDLKERKRDGEPLTVQLPGAPKTIKDLFARFYESYLVRNRRDPERAEQTLRIHCWPYIGSKRPDQIRAHAVAELIDKIAVEKSEATAKRVLSELKQMTRWAAARGLLEYDPLSPLSARQFGLRSAVRERALDIDEHGVPVQGLPEICRLWTAVERSQFSFQVRAGIKILLLTGVRSGELRLAKWEHVDLAAGEWLVPKSTTAQGKAIKGRTTVVPLSPPALKLFKELKEVTGGSEWVMASPRNPQEPLALGSFSKALDKLQGFATAPIYEDGKPVLNSKGRPKTRKTRVNKSAPLADLEKFSPHDFRRTLRSHVVGLGVSEYIAERLLNHTLTGVEANYNKRSYLDERREALNLWAEAVEQALDEFGGKA